MQQSHDVAAGEASAALALPPRKLLRGLVIGQAPPGPPDTLPEGYQPLQGQPEKRLTKLAGFKSPEALWAVFDRIDLIGWCPGPKDRKDYHQVKKAGYTKHNCDGHRFPLHLARLAAGRLLNFGGPLGDGSALRDYSVVVLCGRLVAAAFGLRLRNALPWAEESGGVRYLVMPHPSGVSHLWNDAWNHHRAAAAFRAALEVAGLTPAGGFEVPPSSSISLQRPGPKNAALKKARITPARQRRLRRLCGPLSTKVSSGSPLQDASSLLTNVGAAATPMLGLAGSESTARGAASLPEDIIHSRFFSNRLGNSHEG